MLIAILLVIIVIVIIIAVTVLTAGMALGPLAMIGAGILIGAAVGAVTSGLLAIAGNLWSNQEWSTGVAHAVLVGAITGAIGGGIGAGAGLAFKGFSVAVQYGAAMVTAGVLDAAGQFVMNGFSFKNFSWKSLGITLLVTALTLGLAHSVGGPKPTGAPAAGEGGGAHPTVEPGAAPHEPVATGAPTEPVAPPTPTEKITAPAEAVAHPAEPPAGAHPTEPTAGPHPAEPAAPAKPTEPTAPAKPTEPTAPAKPSEPTARAGEPGAEPTKAGTPEAPPAEPGQAPTTPQEKTTLESTATKNGEDLSPSEINTEREVAGRTKGEPINDPPFTSEHELPNGHKIKETPDGKVCERCSPGCGTYDENGKLIGQAEPGPKEAPPTAPKEETTTAPKEEAPAAVRKEEPPPTAPKEEAPPPVPQEEPPAAVPKEEPTATTPKENEPPIEPESPGKAKVKNVKLDELRSSQDWVSPKTSEKVPIEKVAENMKAKGWDPTKPAPDMVECPDGKITTVDHRRLVAAKQAGLEEVPATVHQFDEPIPPETAQRFALQEGAEFTNPATGKSYIGGQTPETWGEAAMFRSANQRVKGAPDFPIEGKPGLPRIGRKKP
jgi:hypothetical protein